MDDKMATGYAKASYTEVIDLQTTNGYTSIIGLHTPVGRRPYDRLHGFFNQFRKYRYRGISSLVMVPAANLPVDPLGLTGVQGTTDLMDPRDALNPILFHGCHGEHLNTILDQIYGAGERENGSGVNYSENGENVSDSAREILSANADIGAYYKCLTDTTWKKFGIQSGVKLKGLHPLVHKLAINAPIIPGLNVSSNTAAILDNNAGMFREYSANTTTAVVETNSSALSNSVGTDLFAPANTVGSVMEVSGETVGSRAQYVQEFTNGMTRLGWLPTTKAAPNTSATYQYNQVQIATLPKLFMGVLVLPPSYNVEQYFRCVIRHEFEFSQFTTSLGAMYDYNLNETNMKPSNNNNYFNWIDYGSSKIAEGETIDMLNGKSDVISDGVA